MAIKSLGKQEIIKLDLYDKKILYHLHQNSRIPQKKLAKMIGISPQRLSYKIDRLKSELIEPAAIFNFPLLNINSYIILAPQLSEEIIEDLKNESLFFFIQGIGKYQYILNIVTDDILGFCLKHLPDYHVEIYPIIRYIPDNYNPFSIKEKPIPLFPDKRISLDKKDYKILEILGKHPVESMIGLGNLTGIDRQTIGKRLKRMEKSNTISKYRYAINVFRLGFFSYLLKVRIVPRLKQTILGNIRTNDYSGFVFETVDGFFFFFMPPSHNELFSFTKDLEKIDPTIRIDIIQNGGYLKVEPVPEKIIEIFRQRSIT